MNAYNEHELRQMLRRWYEGDSDPDLELTIARQLASIPDSEIAQDLTGDKVIFNALYPVIPSADDALKAIDYAIVKSKKKRGAFSKLMYAAAAAVVAAIITTTLMIIPGNEDNKKCLLAMQIDITAIKPKPTIQKHVPAVNTAPKDIPGTSQKRDAIAPPPADDRTDDLDNYGYTTLDPTQAAEFIASTLSNVKSTISTSGDNARKELAQASLTVEAATRRAMLTGTTTLENTRLRTSEIIENLPI